MIDRPPSSAAAASTATCIASGSPTSTAYDGPPTSLAAAAAESASMSKTATCAPSSAIRRHVARPMPDPPPVTTARLPSSRPIGRLLSCLFGPLEPGRLVRHHHRLVELTDEQLLRHAQVERAVLA